MSEEGAEEVEEKEVWIPRTKLGRLVQAGEITSINEAFAQGYRIREVGIVNALLPNLQQEVVSVDLVQKQTDAGERSRFKAIVAVGNGEGYVGVGSGKAKQVRTAIEKATFFAKLNIIPIRRGCGSWECDCGEPHSLPFKVKGRCGSVRVEIHPGPKGLGLVAGDVAKAVLRLAGIKDCWTKTYGSTRTATSMAFATFNALKNTFRITKPEYGGE